MMDGRAERPATWILVAALVLVQGCRGSTYPARLATGDQVRLARPIKGNDLVVTKGVERARVRLVGVYAFDPAANQGRELNAWAAAALEAVGGELGDRWLGVELIRAELDPRGRHLGFLSAGDTDVGLWLIERGLGAVYTEYPFAREERYLAVEREARAAGRGLWQSAAARTRLAALRDTWAAVRRRAVGTAPADALLEEVRR